MGWLTQEQKGDLAAKGLDAGIEFFKSMTAESKRIKDEAKENIKNVDENEIQNILDINEEYVTRVNNLLYDTELGCKFKRTEEIFLMIVEIIMLDLENDYTEVIGNFTKAIDTEQFIDLHDLSIKKREERIDKEFAEILNGYEIEMSDYRKKVEEHKSKNFFSKIFADDPIEPERPTKRS